MTNTEFSPGRREARARMMRRRRVTIGVAAGFAVVLVGGGITWAVVAANREPERSGEQAVVGQAASPTPQASSTPDPTTPAAPVYDVDSPDSITVVVNKQRPMNPLQWAPDDLVYPNLPNNNEQPLRQVAGVALEAMNEAATADGVPLIIASAYRSYDEQDGLFARYAASDGQEAADAYSARPGHSEHQTGLGVDLDDGSGCALEECFGETETGQWLRANSWRYGYILRYDNGEQATVGYLYEPWHFRYVGVDVATAMHEQGVKNLEDFMGLPAAPSY